jgi:hypothetical protein
MSATARHSSALPTPASPTPPTRSLLTSLWTILPPPPLPRCAGCKCIPGYLEQWDLVQSRRSGCDVETTIPLRRLTCVPDKTLSTGMVGAMLPFAPCAQGSSPLLVLPSMMDLAETAAVMPLPSPLLTQQALPPLRQMATISTPPPPPRPMPHLADTYP